MSQVQPTVERVAPFRILDTFRGFAALWVVMVHCCDRWLPTQDPRYYLQPLYAFSMKGQLGVILFFVISGYCITAAAYGALVSGKPVGRYAFERARRIYPPYIACIVLTVISALVIRWAASHHLIGEVHHLIQMPHSARFWLGNILLLQYEVGSGNLNPVFWSLCYEVVFYAIIGVFLYGAKLVAQRHSMGAGVRLLVWAIGLSTVAGLTSLIAVGGAWFPFDLWHQFSLGGLLFFLLELGPSTTPDWNDDLRKTVIGLTILAALLTVVFIATRQVGYIDIGHPSSKERSSFSLLFCLALIGLRRYDAKLSASKILHPLMWLGAMSYSLYLAHPLILPYVDILTRRAGIDGDRYWISFLVQLVVAVAFSRLFYFLVERHFVSARQKERLKSEHLA